MILGQWSMLGLGTKVLKCGFIKYQIPLSWMNRTISKCDWSDIFVQNVFLVYLSAIFVKPAKCRFLSLISLHSLVATLGSSFSFLYFLIENFKIIVGAAWPMLNRSSLFLLLPVFFLKTSIYYSLRIP